MPCPCSLPNSKVRRIKRSSVPCSSAIRSSSGFCVDILPERNSFLVGCQPEPACAADAENGRKCVHAASEWPVDLLSDREVSAEPLAAGQPAAEAQRKLR